MAQVTTRVAPQELHFCIHTKILQDSMGLKKSIAISINLI